MEVGVGQPSDTAPYYATTLPRTAGDKLTAATAADGSGHRPGDRYPVTDGAAQWLRGAVGEVLDDYTDDDVFGYGVA